MELKNNKLSIIRVLCSLLLVFSCDNNSDNPLSVPTDPCEMVIRTPDSLLYFASYEKPIITAPDTSITPIFYSDELVNIKWELPNSLWNTELQIIELNKPYDCLEYEKFHLLYNNFSIGYGNQFFHHYRLNQYNGVVSDTVFVAYRLRSTDIGYPQKYSLWTNVSTFTMVPLVNLKKDVVTVGYNFSFITEEGNEHYYSGVLSKSNYKLRDIAIDNNLNFEKIRFVRPIKFEVDFISRYQNSRNPFSQIMVGFNEDFEINKAFYPFEVFGTVSPGSYEESPVKGTLFYANSGNYYSEMNKYDLKVAYKLEDAPGTNHQIKINLIYEVFSDY